IPDLAFGLPCAIQRIEKAAGSLASCAVAQHAIGGKDQSIPRKCKQDVVTRLRRAMRHTLQQAWVALRNSRRRREQIAPAAQATAMAAHARSVDQTRRKASVPLVPPKPNELEMATSSFASRAVCATKSRSQPSPGSSRLIVGGNTWSRSARMLKIASTPPAAPSRWPVVDLVELIASFLAWSPNTFFAAITSPRSPSGVEVPCALMYCTSAGLRPASSSAVWMQRAAPSPPSLGAVMWNASPLMPKPTSSAWMRAPRALACSYSSSISTPAPSDNTKPSRSLSHGRLALVGSSLRVDIALAEQKPAIAVPVVANSEPPATITSASPYWIILAARPMLCVAVAQAVTQAMFGPFRPNMIDR